MKPPIILAKRVWNSEHYNPSSNCSTEKGCLPKDVGLLSTLKAVLDSKGILPFCVRKGTNVIAIGGCVDVVVGVVVVLVCAIAGLLAITSSSSDRMISRWPRSGEGVVATD